jgi:hypothetical protein
MKAKGTAGMTTNILVQASSLSLVLLVGCVAPGPKTKESSAGAISRKTASLEEIRHRIDYWNEEATELHEMAERREREADVLRRTQKESPAEELVTRMRALAKQLHAAAEYADEQAKEAQRQVQE